MRVLVTAASRHDATRSIANDVARLLGTADHVARVLSRAERARAHRLRAADGDHRNWPEIRCWTTDISRQLDTPPRRSTKE